jgi:hypothetical protein
MRGHWLSVLTLVGAPLGAQQMVFRGPGGGGAGDASALLDVAPAAYGVTAWRVGEWARYNVSQVFGGTGQSLTRFRTVSVVDGAGTDGFWVELTEETVGVMRATMPVRKLRIPFGPVQERAMTEALTLLPDSSIRRTTVVRPPAGRAGPAPFPDGWERLAEETITTPAGEFRARHYRKGDEELWAAAAAGPIGLVRYRGGDVTIELVARSATGARSRIPAGGAQ